MFIFRHILTLGAALLLCAPAAQATEQAQEWELVQPTGVIQQSSVKPATPLTFLEGKTIALRWNGKNNGDVVLDHLADRLGLHLAVRLGLHLAGHLVDRLAGHFA